MALEGHISILEAVAAEIIFILDGEVEYIGSRSEILLQIAPP